MELRLIDTSVPVLSEIEGIPGASEISNVLTAAECEYFILSVIPEELLDTTALEGGREVFPKRISMRTKLTCPALAQDFLDRLRPVLPNELTFQQEDLELGAFLTGTWKLHSVNECISFLKYPPGGVFTRHRDGIYIPNEDTRSLISILVYLNADYEGGETMAFSDDGTVQATVQPATGNAFCMLQRVLHQGNEVIVGFKHVIRLDLLYQRVAEYSTERMENNQLAEQYLQMACDFERAHEGMKAVECYKKAFKLNPRLERML